MSYIDQSDIYKATDQGKLVFQHYFPDYPFGKTNAKFKLRPGEKTDSATITHYRDMWRITDFGNQQEVNSLPAIQFVMWREGLEYKDALAFINSELLGNRVNGLTFQKPTYQPRYDWREMGPDDHKGHYSFTYKDAPSQNDLESIGRYIDADLLKMYRCRTVDQYEYCGPSKTKNRDIVHIFKATEDYPIFVFDYGDFKKLYKPNERNKQYRFSYIGEKPKDFVYGLRQVGESENEFVDEEGNTSLPEYKPNAVVRDLFRCSGESDALNLASLGSHMYWLNSETATMSAKQWEEVDQLCENHYQVMDLDETGRQAGLRFALRHINLHSVYLPKWLEHKYDWRGNTCKDLKDFVTHSGSNLEETTQNFLVLKRKAMPMKFWYKTIANSSGKVSYHLNLEYFYHFLKAHGFYVMDSIYHRKAGYCYARLKGKVIDLIHPDDIKKIVKRFTKEWIRRNNLMDENAILNKINSSNQISEANLQELAKIEPELVNCNKKEEYLHFTNGSLRITKDTIEKVDQKHVPNQILGSLEINSSRLSHLHKLSIRMLKEPIVEVSASPEYGKLLNRIATVRTNEEREKLNTEIASFPELERYTLKIRDQDFIFIQFLKDLAHIHWRKELEQGQVLTEEEKKEQELVLINLLFVLGWNMAEYKDPGRPWLTFLQDMKISEVGKSTGRSGKSLLSQAIGHVRPSFYVAGRHRDITNKTDFIYDGFTIFHNNIEIDDLYEHADFNFFYTQVSGKREVNSKFISKQILDYPDSGKMLISSNFELQNTDSSTLARILNAGVSDYYHEKTKYNDYKETRTPVMKFGRSLYDDFTEEEWNKFYNLMAHCIQLSQRFFKIQPPMSNLEKRQLRREMTRGLGKDEPFFIWANGYFRSVPDGFDNEYSPDDEKLAYFNTYIVKEKAFNDFLEDIPKSTASRYKKTQFKAAIKAYCEYYGYTFNPVEKCGTNQGNIDARRIVKTIFGKSTEVFYIKTDEESPVKDCVASQNETDDELPF